MDSILTSIKKLLGIVEEYEHFDPDIVMYINSAFSVLTQLGVGPEEGFRIEEARNCIGIVHDIRHASPIGLKGDYHPLAKFPLVKHPFGWGR